MIETIEPDPGQFVSAALLKDRVTQAVVTFWEKDKVWSDRPAEVDQPVSENAYLRIVRIKNYVTMSLKPTDASKMNVWGDNLAEFVREQVPLLTPETALKFVEDRLPKLEKLLRGVPESAGEPNQSIPDELIENVEHIVAAAIRLNNGQVFTGPAHFEAMIKAARSGLFNWPGVTTGLTDDYETFDPYESISELEPTDGWLTSTGRFVDREEAAAIAHNAKQTASNLKSLHSGDNPLVAENQPTDAQIKAGNYKKGHRRWEGFEITVENRKGSKRRGVDRGGKEWEVTMPASYGYIRQTEGRDGDHVDVYIGPEPDTAELVYVVDQIDADTRVFDEHKCMVGFPSQAQAEATYKRGFSDGKGEDRMGEVTPMTVADFKEWVLKGDTAKAVAYVKKRKVSETLSIVEQFVAKGGAVLEMADPNPENVAGARNPVLTAAGKLYRWFDLHKNTPEEWSEKVDGPEGTKVMLKISGSRVHGLVAIGDESSMFWLPVEDVTVESLDHAIKTTVERLKGRLAFYKQDTNESADPPPGEVAAARDPALTPGEKLYRWYQKISDGTAEPYMGISDEVELPSGNVVSLLRQPDGNVLVQWNSNSAATVAADRVSPQTFDELIQRLEGSVHENADPDPGDVAAARGAALTPGEKLVRLYWRGVPDHTEEDLDEFGIFNFNTDNVTVEPGVEAWLAINDLGFVDVMLDIEPNGTGTHAGALTPDEISAEAIDELIAQQLEEERQNRELAMRIHGRKVGEATDPSVDRVAGAREPVLTPAQKMYRWYLAVRDHAQDGAHSEWYGLANNLTVRLTRIGEDYWMVGDTTDVPDYAGPDELLTAARSEDVSLETLEGMLGILDNKLNRAKENPDVVEALEPSPEEIARARDPALTAAQKLARWYDTHIGQRDAECPVLEVEPGIGAWLAKGPEVGVVLSVAGNPVFDMRTLNYDDVSPESIQRKIDGMLPGARDVAESRLESQEEGRPPDHAREFIGRDDKFWNIGPQYDDIDPGDSPHIFKDNDYSAVVCTGYACAIQQKLGRDRVKIYGFSREDNPGSLIARDFGGHDFAVVDDRFIVDPWLVDVAEVQSKGVFDLENDADEVLWLYGPRSNWKELDLKLESRLREEARVILDGEEKVDPRVLAKKAFVGMSPEFQAAVDSLNADPSSFRADLPGRNYHYQLEHGQFDNMGQKQDYWKLYYRGKDEPVLAGVPVWKAGVFETASGAWRLYSRLERNPVSEASDPDPEDLARESGVVMPKKLVDFLAAIPDWGWAEVTVGRMRLVKLTPTTEQSQLYSVQVYEAHNNVPFIDEIFETPAEARDEVLRVWREFIKPGLESDERDRQRHLARRQRRIGEQLVGRKPRVRRISEKEKDDGWIGVDLDGTLALHLDGKFDKDTIGDPVPAMVTKIKGALKKGRTVKIFTARAADKENVPPIKQWLKDNDLPDLEVTNEKDPGMTELWDDRARKVKKNAGTFESRADDEIYRILEPLKCGPFDGGCMVYARALQKIYGGELYALVGRDATHPESEPVVQHAVVKVGDKFLDAEGVSSEDELRNRWQRDELVDVTALRPLEPGELSEAPDDPRLVDDLVAYLSRKQAAESKEPDPRELARIGLGLPQEILALLYRAEGRPNKLEKIEWLGHQVLVSRRRDGTWWYSVGKSGTNNRTSDSVDAQWIQRALKRALHKVSKM